jgi:transcriptional regulator with XRE-family HTH domain
LIEARTAAGLSQAQLARRMKTSQSYIARIEGGKVRPSTDALERWSASRRRRARVFGSCSNQSLRGDLWQGPELSLGTLSFSIRIAAAVAAATAGRVVDVEIP